MSRGYLNRPGLTHDSFVADPFFRGDMMYRTGDYAVLLPDGHVVYLGRRDNQVKIRGFRIELEEIESVLLGHPGIQEAAVIDRDDPGEVKYLAAYVVTRQDLTLKDLRNYLSEKLPDYMIPSVFFKVDNMPLTTSGKLDRRTLSGIGTIGASIKGEARYQAPRNELEHQLSLTWGEIFNQDRIGIDDHFFEIGGDSLKANLLLVKIKINSLLKIGIFHLSK